MLSAAGVIDRLGAATDECPHEARRAEERYQVPIRPSTPWGRVLALLQGTPGAIWLCRDCLDTMRSLTERRAGFAEVHRALAPLGYDWWTRTRFWWGVRRLG